MYAFVGKSSPFLVLAFLALLDGGEKTNGLILPKKKNVKRFKCGRFGENLTGLV